MVCDICGKNQATVHLTEIIDDQMSELHLCEECARKKSQQMESQFGLADLLAGLAEFGKPQEEKGESVKLKCPNCGMTYENFIKMGRLGCSECYYAFKKYLVPLLKKIHGTSQHVGKAPHKLTRVVKAAPQDEMQVLRDKLQKAVEAEEFEEAARIRDQIKEAQKSKAGVSSGKETKGDAR
ncbi:MAG: UvrB/UvrC motif-containing protein [Candidatus Omnitrophica bacterium]|nr:UvrB/UvrC motif-containing protein [Candidatus Omnitrophota bacterium]MDD5237223.1 UvrB/UvrC motif-containing protein [Candidatus Omnitrophota bacterium]MDD5610117.1 UvrB/UvrC motif-containing protein [Candidatus Omnitrophota bacterium]